MGQGPGVPKSRAGGGARGAGASAPAGAPPARRLAHQVPDAQQDGAGADMAAQAAAVGVEPRPGRDHLHRSGRGRRGASARPSLQERRPRRSGPAGGLLPAPPPLPLPLPARLPRLPVARAPRLCGEVRATAAAGPCAPKAAGGGGAGGGGAGHVTRARARDVTAGSSQLRAPRAGGK